MCLDKQMITFSGSFAVFEKRFDGFGEFVELLFEIAIAHKVQIFHFGELVESGSEFGELGRALLVTKLVVLFEPFFVVLLERLEQLDLVLAGAADVKPVFELLVNLLLDSPDELAVVPFDDDLVNRPIVEVLVHGLPVVVGESLGDLPALGL